MKNISVKTRFLQDAIKHQEVWLRMVGTKTNVADGLTKSGVLLNMLTALKIELTEPQHENVSINNITARSVQKDPVDAHPNSTRGARGINPSAGHTNIVTDHKGYKNKVVNIVMDCMDC